MISSMTAYSICEIKNTWGNIIWELRSVNQRYLEICIRLPETFRNLEPVIRDRVRNRLTRGKIECHLRFDLAPNKKCKLQLDELLAKELVQAAKWVKIQSDEGVINPLDILRWPGVMLMQEECEFYSINSELLAGFDNTLDEFISMRKSEGKALKSLIEQRLKNVTQEVSKIRMKIPDVIKLQHARFIEKLKSVEIQLDNNRLEQELIMIIQRMDITEELDRLDTHVKETFEILKKNEAIGRRLDFMMQEFNRESNTLASKSNSTDITASAIELKVLIEQMREQIQNIE